MQNFPTLSVFIIGLVGLIFTIEVFGGYRSCLSKIPYQRITMFYRIPFSATDWNYFERSNIVSKVFFNSKWEGAVR